MDVDIYLKQLSTPELEVEYIVRGLSSKATDARVFLVNTYSAEQLDKTIKPKGTHVKENPETEIEICRNKYDELSRASQEQPIPPPKDFVTIAYAKIIHYKDRTNRLINTFGETPFLASLFSNWRRAFNLYHKFWTEYQGAEPQVILHPPTETHGMATSSFVEKIDQLINNVASDQTNQQNTGNTKPTQQTGNANQARQQIPNNELNQLKNSVSDFFSKMDARYSKHLQTAPNPNSINDAFNRSDRTDLQPQLFPNQQNLLYNEMYSRQPTSVQSPRFHLENFYKIRQKWNLSFDGIGGLNVHDFIYRLEQMACDDNLPLELLTKVLHHFLSKKAEDWYWIYKSNHPVTSWTEMKSAIISYFSSSNYEEEIKENILKRVQSGKESFSDFSLSIQKMNARLHNRLSESQIIYRLCQNMYPALKNVTLPYHNSIRSIEELRILCQEYEKLWEQTGYDPRRFGDTYRRKPNVNEINLGMQNLSFDQTQSPRYIQEHLNTFVKDNSETTVEAFKLKNERRYPEKVPTKNYAVCWNCKDLGHRYEDCVKPFLDIFCFGCGAPNVRKPNCSNCLRFQSENRFPSAGQMKGQRLGGNGHQLESSEPNTQNPS